MKNLFLCIFVAFCGQLACAQNEPIVAVNNITIRHEHRGWRVICASVTPVHYNLIKNDLIVRIDGRNAVDTGPMLMAGLFNLGKTQIIHLFIERGALRLETTVQEIGLQGYDPVAPNPFKHVASGFGMPDAEMFDINGQQVTFEQYKGKWLLINFTASWCTSCTDEIPDVLTATKHLELNLLTVALKDTADSARRMQQKFEIPSPVVAMKPLAELPIDFGITTNSWTGQIPGYVLVRPDGDIALIAIGVKYKDLEASLQCAMFCTADAVMREWNQ